MPHVIVKLWPGRTEAQKEALTKKIQDAVKETMGSQERSISIAIEEVPEEKWMSEVFTPDIIDKKHTLYKKPGYNKELL